MSEFDDLGGDEPLLPSIIGLEGITDPATKKFALAVKEILEVRLGTRPRASQLDRGLTFRDLYRYNIASFDIEGQSVSNPAPQGGIIGTGGTAGTGTPTEEEVDLTAPGAPLGFIATGTKLAVLLEWDEPATSVAYTEVYRASVDNIGLSVLIGTTEATIYADIIGATDITNFYWIRFVSMANVQGPYNSISGTVATTGKIGSNDLISVDGAKIIDATILNAKIANVSADKITTGTLAVGQSIQVGAAANRIFIDGNGIIRSGGMLDYLNGSGFYLRAAAGSAQVSFGNATNYIGFNGTNISIDTPNFKILGDQLTFNGSGTFNGNGTFSGNLSAVNGTLASLTINPNGKITLGSNSFINSGQTAFATGNGYYLENVGGNTKFSLGSGTAGTPTRGISYNSISNEFILHGDLIATGNVKSGAISQAYSAYTAAFVNVGGGVNIQTLSVTADGITIFSIVASALFNSVGTGLALYRDGVLLGESVVSTPFDTGGAAGPEVLGAIFALDTPPIGIAVYTLRTQDGTSARQRIINAINLKR